MKKLVSILLAVMLVFAVAVSVSAATITVQDVLDGETYTAYKILNYTDNGESGDDRAVSYYLTADEYTSIGSVLEAAGFGFTAASDGSLYYVNNAETIDVAAAAASLAGAALGDALGKYTATGASGSATFTDLPAGYYFVTTTAGSLCALHEDSGIATVVEKNTVPEIDKTQSADGTTYADTKLDMNIGDTVYYKVEVTDGIGTNAAITITDVLSEGLTLNQDSIEVKNGGTAVDAANYSVTEKSASGFTLTLNADYIASLDANATITVTYTAVINENAVIDDDDANSNTVTMTYSNQTQTDVTYVETYDFIVYKTDGTSFLDGAEFKLYDAATEGNQILLSKDDTGYYKDAAGSADTTIDIDSADGCNVRGLAPGTYYLEEVAVPGGYNKLSAREPVTVTADATAAVEITVVNNPGTELPSTGGIGTTIFYVVGGLLIVAAGVLLITRKRMSRER